MINRESFEDISEAICLLLVITMYRLCYMFQLVQVILWHISHSVPLSLSMVPITLSVVSVGYHPVIFHSHHMAYVTNRVHDFSL